MADARDPRPLTTEPLALDLVNTAWPDDTGWHDLLDDAALASAWLARWKLPAGDGKALANLKRTRAAIRDLLERPDDPAPRDAVDAVLGQGRLRLTLEGGRPAERIETTDAWRASWLAARDLLRLLDERPQRLKHCAGEGCVLWFDDTTKSGTRRWCSMAGCGNRAKARRHYSRQRATATGSHNSGS